MTDPKDAMKKLIEHFGSRMGFLGNQILMLSLSGQPCDVTFYKRKPILNVKIDPKINLALMYGAGPKKLQEMLENIKLSSGDVVSINEIWVIHPMPATGFSEEELNAVDLSEAEKKVGPEGETIREMIKQTYHCTSQEEEDKFIRRYFAS